MQGLGSLPEARRQQLTRQAPDRWPRKLVRSVEAGPERRLALATGARALTAQTRAFTTGGGPARSRSPARRGAAAPSPSSRGRPRGLAVAARTEERAGSEERRQQDRGPSFHQYFTQISSPASSESSSVTPAVLTMSSAVRGFAL